MFERSKPQIVFTLTARCRDCYRCLRACPVKAIRMQNGQAYVDEKRCIACGTCIRECPQQAKTFRNDIDVARRLILEALAGVPHDAIWIPASESYIALGHDGQGVAWIGKGYVQVKERPVVELPWFQEHGAGDRTARDEARGETCAVHRTREGRYIALSPVCPHMKCHVKWNQSEQSWDCPCHGSRFDTEGRVLEGPALTGLEPRQIGQ